MTTHKVFLGSSGLDFQENIMKIISSPDGKKEKLISNPMPIEEAVASFALFNQAVRERARALVKEGRTSSWTVSLKRLNDGSAQVTATGTLGKPQKRRKPSCGALCRSGEPCKAKVSTRYDGSPSTRCHLHGGASTGPKTEIGRAAIAISNQKRALLLTPVSNEATDFETTRTPQEREAESMSPL